MIRFPQQLQRKTLVDSYIIEHEQDNQDQPDFLIVGDGWILGTHDTIK